VQIQGVYVYVFQNAFDLIAESRGSNCRNIFSICDDLLVSEGFEAIVVLYLPFLPFCNECTVEPGCHLNCCSADSDMAILSSSVVGQT